MKKMMILVITFLAANAAHAFTCKENVEILVAEHVPQNFTISVTLNNNKLENDGDTQLWQVVASSPSDASDKRSLSVVTSGEGEAMCLIKGLFVN